jgi:hypothetical protein
METKNPARVLGFLKFLTTKYLAICVQSYKEIELETFCFVPSWSSIQPVKPTIINAKANTEITFFIVKSSKLFLIIVALISKHGAIYTMSILPMQ